MEFRLFITVSSVVKNSVVHHFREHELKYEVSKLAVQLPIREKRVKVLAKKTSENWRK
jgi:hypothetical protein